jgi:tyrosyl-tRNA synthetase
LEPVRAGSYKLHDLIVAVGAAPSKSEATRLVRQGAVRIEGAVVTPGTEIAVAPDRHVVLAVGPKRFFRIVATEAWRPAG